VDLAPCRITDTNQSGVALNGQCGATFHVASGERCKPELDCCAIGLVAVLVWHRNPKWNY